MLAHSPSSSVSLRKIVSSPEDEDGIIPALRHDRRVRLYDAGSTMQKLIAAMDEENPRISVYLASTSS